MQGSFVCASTQYLTSGLLQHLLELLLLDTPQGLVIDLSGRTFKGPLRGSPPHRLVLSNARTVIRNGTLQLPDDAQMVVTAPGCRLEVVTIRGPGIFNTDEG